jgi:hypothetical protein
MITSSWIVRGCAALAERFRKSGSPSLTCWQALFGGQRTELAILDRGSHWTGIPIAIERLRSIDIRFLASGLHLVIFTAWSTRPGEIWKLRPELEAT